MSLDKKIPLLKISRVRIGVLSFVHGMILLNIMTTLGFTLRVSASGLSCFEELSGVNEVFKDIGMFYEIFEFVDDGSEIALSELI